MQGSSLMFYIEVIASVLFCASRRKKEPKNAVLECFASAEATRALPLTCEPLKRLDPNFHQCRSTLGVA